MKLRILLFVGLLAFTSWEMSYAQGSLDVKALIEQMTLEEKERVVVGSEMEIPWSEGGSTGVGQVGGEVPGAAGKSLTNKRLGLNTVVFADGPAGVRIDPIRPNESNKTFYATAFPVATMLASSFNLELMKEVGTAFGHEAKEYGVDILLAPALNIHRNPLGGRNFEYYSEDPYLSGKMASYFTQGVQEQGVGVSIKHYAANNQETNRARVDAVITERAMREIYLRGFEIAIKESDPWTVMTAYNKVNGAFASESEELLTTILREEWGFDGFVMTDWFAGTDIPGQLKAGNDLLMPGTPGHKGLIVQAVKDGKMSEEDLNKNVEAILNIYKQTLEFKGYESSGSPDLKASQAIAKKAATEGVILLKNEEGALPLASSAKLALFGVASYETIATGTGSGNVNKAYSISIAQGLENSKQAIHSELQEVYTQYIKKTREDMGPKAWSFGPDKILPEKIWTQEEIAAFVAQSEMGIFTLNRTSGEFYDRQQGYDFYLSQEEQDLIKNISAAYRAEGKKFVVILNIGGVIETQSWKEYADAILLMWQAGQEGGDAVADILTGKVSPSGKLPMTFPNYYMDHYSSRNFPGRELVDNPYPSPFDAVESEVIYEEGIYVGYRYFETFDVGVSYPFGYGLSYTQFEFSDLKAAMTDEGELTLKCKVRNTGSKAGKEVAQVYVSSPDGKLEKPAKELRAFAKTQSLKPGKSETLIFELNAKDLASFDSATSTWILEKGIYTISIGGGLHDLQLSDSVVLKSGLEVMKTSKSMAPKREIDVLTKRKD
ncbi:glycoside hydrolase family 3 C-terminal domain-containing protein [Reichenbachiella ulvae]|uniref:Glycoside hydrolase family 3 C-terminal domain-containing protein n=1 Tax=Reichenbachiella ulvae TaxID=2980104 RepID=A0ABT3CVY6_9BACT|nr:glycoside hydrolase family 3 C-terminal domain-containing protein [Reichenbachiella ulvae]MCV9387403.1 glycoside hydrolase family 3 C-terminal domain-containing protein [Reichenbachiella ulvae]